MSAADTGLGSDVSVALILTETHFGGDVTSTGLQLATAWGVCGTLIDDGTTRDLNLTQTVGPFPVVVWPSSK